MIFNSTVINSFSGLFASIIATGVAQSDTVTLTTPSGKVKSGKWVSHPNPDYVGLPDGYTQLEYIASTGTQYIDTGFVPTLNTKVEFKISSSSTQPNTYPQLFGAQQKSDGTNRFGITSDWVAKTGSTGMAASTVVRDIPREGSLEYNKYVLDGVTYTATGSWTPANASLYLFSGNSADGSYDGKVTLRSVAKFYYFKIRNAGVLIRDFVPAKRNSDSAIGLYDIVNSVFYTNSGTGAFAAGENVQESIEYYLFDRLGEVGTYTLAASNGIKTVYEPVTVSGAELYAVLISYFAQIVNYTMLYDSSLGDATANQCRSATGGWTSSAALQSNKTRVTPTYQSDGILCALPTSGTQKEVIANTASMIDFSEYTKMLVKYRISVAINWGSFGVRESLTTLSRKIGFSLCNADGDNDGINDGNGNVGEYIKIVDCISAKGYPVIALQRGGDPDVGTLKLSELALFKADDWQTLASVSGITASSMDALLAESSTILSNVNAVSCMVRKCTGDFMLSAIQNATFLSALENSPYANEVYANEHWAKFLAMVA